MGSESLPRDGRHDPARLLGDKADLLTLRVAYLVAVALLEAWRGNEGIEPTQGSAEERQRVEQTIVRTEEGDRG